MSASPLGKNRKAMWQGMVMSIIHRLHPSDLRAGVMRETMLRVAGEADFMLDELDKRFPNSEVKPAAGGGYVPARSTLTVKR